MKEKYLYNSISSLLIFIFIITPFLVSVPKAEAQATTYSISGTQSGSIGGYLSGVSKIATQLPLCKDKLGGAVKGLFKKAKVTAKAPDSSDVTSGSAYQADDNTDPNLDSKNKNASNKSESIYTYDDALYNVGKTVSGNTGESANTAKEEAENNQCLKSIGQLLIKEMLQKLTVSTVNWINNGNEGGPFFVQNEHGYFESLIRQEILIFNSELDNPSLYPFAKNLIKSKVLTYQNKFANNARYSLDEAIARTTPEFTASDFQNDFSKGGWNAWLGMTQISANNPLGFYMLASDELQKRLDESNNTAARVLLQNSGFLADERCADPKGVTRESEREALKHITRDAKGNIEGKCKRWEQVTPGKIIAELATKKANHQEDALLKADDLNAAIAAILDAGINKFTNNIQVNGFFGLSDEGIDGSYEIDQDNLLPGDDELQTNQDFNQFQIGEWLQNNPDFNLRTDLTQALIDEQRTYREKAEEQNVVLGDLVKTIYQLDYCIPGPHPGWEADSRDVLSAVENSIISKSKQDVEDLDKEQIGNLVKVAGQVGGTVAGAAIGASLGTVILPVVGTAIGAAIGFLIGFVVGWVGDQLLGDKSYQNLDFYYASIFNKYTGVKMFNKQNSGSEQYLQNKQDITNPLDTMLSRYIQLIHKYYPIEWLPNVAKDAAKEFRKSIGYNEIYKENADKIILMDGIVKRLGNIKDAIDALNAKLKSGGINNIDYEIAIKPYFNEFSSVSKNMVTGDEIAQIDNITKQATQEIKYVYEDLLKGEFGCEKDLEFKRAGENPVIKPGTSGSGYGTVTYILLNTLRANYPVNTWYDYNELKSGEIIPDAPAEFLVKYKIDLKKNSVAHMPTGIAEADYGPGFLTTVYLDHSFDVNCVNRLKEPWALDCLKISDLFYIVDSWGITAGFNIDAKDYKEYINDPSTYLEKKYKIHYDPGGIPFEQTIGVY